MAAAGAGTDHKGYGTCRWHFGNAPNHVAHAAKLQAQEKLTLGEPVKGMTPGRMLAGLLNLQAGDLVTLAGLVREHDDLSAPEAQPILRLYHDEKRLSAQIGKLAADAGVQERLTSLAEDQTALVAQLIEAVAEDIAITPEQKQLLGPSVRRRLRLMQGEPVVEGAAA